MKLIPKEKAGIHPPKGGWKKNTLYECEVSFSSKNPAHTCVFYSGFLNPKGEPSGYNRAFNPTWEDEIVRITDVYYLKAVRKLNVDFSAYLKWSNDDETC